MSLLQDEDLAFLRESFQALENDVTLTAVVRQPSLLVVPGRENATEDASAEVKQVCEEVASTSERLKLEVVDADKDADRAVALTGGKLPAIVMSSPTAKGKIRYYGLPAGYEMSALVATLLDLGRPQDVPEEVSQRLGSLPTDVHIQVFVTPT